MTNVTIPESVTVIDNYAFSYCYKLTTIKGKKGSYAETYANEKGYEFEAINNDNPGNDNTVTFTYGGVTVTASISVIPVDTRLILGRLGTSTDADAYKKFEDIISKNDDITSKQIVVYTAKPENGSVTTNGKFKITFDIPAEFEAENVVVIGEDETIYQGVLSNDRTKITIETDKLGNYAVVEKDMSNNDNSEVNMGLMGDLDGNKKVDLNDAKLLLKGAVGITDK